MFELVPWRRRDRDLMPSFGTFRREIDDLFSRFFGEEALPAPFQREFLPVIDISETDKEINVKAEIPGVDPKDLDISISGSALTIKGEKKVEKEEKGEGFHRVERSFGAFSRSFTLPCEVEEDKIKASYKDGILSLKIPKSPTAQKKSITVEVQ